VIEVGVQPEVAVGVFTAVGVGVAPPPLTVIANVAVLWHPLVLVYVSTKAFMPVTNGMLLI
jgi:hypothetical protein